MVRHALLAGCAVLAACAPPAPAPADSAPVIAPAFLNAGLATGVWSFDRTCASGDGMALYPDGTATYDEWGEGRWSLDAEGRLVLEIATVEPGVLDPPADAPRERIVITASEPASEDHLRGVRRMEQRIPAETTIDALKCPTSPPSP